MPSLWRQRLIAQPEWGVMRNWPSIDISVFSSYQRKRFQQNFDAVKRALQGDALRDIAHDIRIHPSALTRLLNRCLGGSLEQEPTLTMGLIPRHRIHTGMRRKPLSSNNSPSGHAHSFTYLLNTVSGLKQHLTKIIKHAKQPSRRGQNITPKAFHSAFIQYLRGTNWPQDLYPFNVSSLGYESARKYLKQKQIEQGIPKLCKRIISSTQVTSRYLSSVEIDAQTIDCHGAVTVALNEDYEDLRISRIHLLQARDVGTGCVLGYILSLTPTYTADDVLALLSLLVRPWKPISLTAPGLSYPPGGCFPAELGEEYRQLMIGMIRMDNALAHLAHKVRSYICNTLGASLNFGLVKQPKGRNTIEHAFAKLNIDIHRLPSTTGSHSQDPVKEPTRHFKKAPLVSLRVLEETVSVILAEHNIRPVGNLGGQSPLSQVRYQCAQHLFAIRPPSIKNNLNAFIGDRFVTIQQDKNHTPHIHFEGVRYRGDSIQQAMLVRTKVNIQFDRRDIRRLSVNTLKGESLGYVYAPKTWQRFPHSLTTRKYINRIIRKSLIERDDPLSGYFNYLLKHRRLPSHALEMVRVYRESIDENDKVSVLENEISSTALLTAQQRRNVLKKIPAWKPDMINRRK